MVDRGVEPTASSRGGGRTLDLVRNVRAGYASRWVAEVVLAALATGVLLLVSGHVPAGDGDRPLDATGFALLVLAGVSMGVSSRWPRTVTVTITFVLCVFVARQYPNGPVWATGLVALIVLAWRTTRRTAVIGWAVMMAALTATAVLVGDGGVLVSVVYVGWSAAAVFGVDALRSRREHLSGLRERAKVLEQTREQAAARRIAEERLRIARDLHDSVAHAMVTINVQAGAAAHVLAQRPEVAGEALAAIQRTSGQVLDELTAMLSVLREDGRSADRLPAPGLWDIAALVDGTAASGLRVSLMLDAPRQDVAPAVSTAAYRVVQESLTNVLRHSLARTARVKVVASPGDSVTLEIVDDGPHRPDQMGGAGVGLRGMRERATATGGTFAAGPTPSGGFAVHATWAGSM
jgi:signal transduction histidine kinase